MSSPPKPCVGDIIKRNGERWCITDVMARLTPYQHAGQHTRVEGYTLGLKRSLELVKEPNDAKSLPSEEYALLDNEGRALSLKEIATLYLKAGVLGAPCAHLAIALAEGVLGDAHAQLALLVLDGGPHTHARATDLASVLLTESKACPFCGGSKPEIMRKDDVCVWVECYDCDATGPLATTIERAWDLWEHRTK